MKLFITIICCLVCCCSLAQLQLAPIFSSHMVLQRGHPIHIWGKAPAGSVVKVQLGSEVRTATTGHNNQWQSVFGVRKASGNPVRLTVSTGTEKIVLEDLLIGDLWVCIGQSNMEWPMAKEKHYAQTRQQASQPLLRLYNPTYAGKNIYGTAFTDSVAQRLTASRFYEGAWQVSDSLSLPTMSAVAWYFGKQLVTATHVPVGLIHLAIGGAPLETFIDAGTLQRSATFSAKVNGNWLNNEALPVWVRERGRQNTSGVSNITTDEGGPAHAYKPGFAFAAGIAPITRMPVKGILCYQGESNAQEVERVEEYGRLTNLLVAGYRARWHQPRLPFYYVQLSSIDTVQYRGQLWPMFRDEQRKMLSAIVNSGMAVCSDSGARHDVHPTNKKIVGERLALWALRNEHKGNVIPSGPLPMDAMYRNGKVLIRFTYAAGLQTGDGKSLRGFSIDGMQETKAVIHGQTIHIAAAAKPAFVYYGWSPFTDVNLVNANKLPASTFKLKVQ